MAIGNVHKTIAGLRKERAREYETELLTAAGEAIATAAEMVTMMTETFILMILGFRWMKVSEV